MENTRGEKLYFPQNKYFFFLSDMKRKRSDNELRHIPTQVDVFLLEDQEVEKQHLLWI